MAAINIPDENRTITDTDAIREFLAPFGIWYEQWPVEGRIDQEASSEEILAAYADEVARIKETGGFVTADVISVGPQTPNIDAICAKFAVEHTHSEDEVRFTVKGRGVFHIHPDNGPVFGVTVESGDMINVPKGTKHWFDLCQDKTIRCIRFFEDQSGWTPHYVDNPVNEKYAPICLGPDYLPPAKGIDPVVKV
jgi:1,2-dihydroxy-3-keto-5-methylthiopentene dioxygenase